MSKTEFNGAPFANLSPAIWRASTVVYDNFDDYMVRSKRFPDGFNYGVTGTPTARQLEQEIVKLQGGGHCVLAPSGLAALVLAAMTFVRGGDHILLNGASYGPFAYFATKWLGEMGVEVEFYAPAEAPHLEQRIKPNTRLIYIETPASITLEMTDVRAIVALAKQHNILTMIDNTWASPLGFRPLDAGVDISAEALTKYINGHSDVLMGSISVSNFKYYQRLREAQDILGQQVSPDDCFLVLRGLETFALRLQTQSQRTLAMAEWLKTQPEIEHVYFPALPSDAGYELWQRDFSLNGTLISFRLGNAQEDAYRAFFNSLKLFAIGASWGGVHSLAAYYPHEAMRSRPAVGEDHTIIRLSIGLEDPTALQKEIRTALDAFQQHR